MKIRSLLLAACIVVVPLIAMFSHRIPPTARAAVGDWFHDLVRGARPAKATAPLEVAPEPVSARPAAASGPAVAGGAEPQVVPVVALAPAALPEPGAQRSKSLQGDGADPATAADNLLHDVHAWMNGPTVGPSRTLRF